MSIELWFFIPWAVFGTAAAIYCQMRGGMYRHQVVLLQAQVREYREARDKGRMALSIEGLWPDLDEKQRLRDRVRELEAAAAPADATRDKAPEERWAEFVESEKANDVLPSDHECRTRRP